ncbi:MAG: class I SAM-dependent methyltransferase [Leptolyngbya sp. DLM2.Bin27]|nr:MAG: class I SAM-dependent methyltransferase [Leptolyngbya sp. DLM2.Bin27]
MTNDVTDQSNKYTKEFFDFLSNSSLSSAKVIAPIIVELLHPKSVVDVGCGQGVWLSVLKSLGIEEVLGIDGDYIQRDKLEIGENEFRASDLNQPLHLDRTFDLVISLEVAEHLPEEIADIFIRNLTNLGKVVLFSAAIPFQGGVNHVNEQWPDYWIKKFDGLDYVPIDCIREKVWKDSRVASWYAQNMIIFIEKAYLAKNRKLVIERQKTVSHFSNLVHPENYIQKCQEISNLKKAVEWYEHHPDPQKLALRDFLKAAPTVFLNGFRRTLDSLFDSSSS